MIGGRDISSVSNEYRVFKCFPYNVSPYSLLSMNDRLDIISGSVPQGADDLEEFQEEERHLGHGDDGEANVEAEQAAKTAQESLDLKENDTLHSNQSLSFVFVFVFVFVFLQKGATGLKL